MEKSKEFQVEYSILLPEARHGNFSTSGNPFDREQILTEIAYHALLQASTPVNWSESLGVNYTISESARLLDTAWDNPHHGNATTEEMLELVNKVPPISKLEKMREMHRQNND